MNRSSHKLSLFSLGILVLSLVVSNASVAQAATWMTGGLNLTASTRTATATVVSPSVSLLTTLGLNKTTVSCTASVLTDANLEKEGKVSQAAAGAKIKFTGCTTTLNGKPAMACTPEVGGVTNVIETERFSAQLGLHTTGEGIIVLTPKTGNIFSVIQMSKTCAIGEKVQVFGSLAVKDSEGLTGLEKEKMNKVHKFKEFEPLTSLKAANSESEGKATLDGELAVEVGMMGMPTEEWNGLPE